MDIDIEELRKKYEDDLMTTRELASFYGVSVYIIRKLCRENNIKLRPIGNIKGKEYHLVSPFKQEVKDVEKMIKLFNDCVSIKEIARKLGVCTHAIERKVKELGLKRPKSMMSRDQYDDSNDEEIARLYKEGKSSTEIAKIINITHRSVLMHLKHMGIERRTLSESQFNYNNKEFPKELESFETLYDMYVENKMSKKDIGLQLNVSPDVVDRVLRKFNITVRGCSESRKGKFVGPKHPNWKGGVTDLYMRIRTYFHVNQVPVVVKRDGKKCTLCGSKKRLNVHHIRPFKEIFYEILSEHKDLDIDKNKEELYDIMVHDDRMNDLDNLITYCRECHLFKIHGYKRSK